MRIDLPSLPLAVLPTPMHPLERLSRHLGGPQVFIKRDDLTGLAFGGNKTRKLSYLLADAVAQGAEVLVTRGAVQSNHCRQTAAAAARCGLDCVLVLHGPPAPTETGNLLLDRLLGARVRWTEALDPESVLEEEIAQLQSRGRRVYRIPYGGSNALGASAYAAAALELKAQGEDFDRILFASSSGGTQAGLVAGARWGELRSQILGISVEPPAAALRLGVADLATSVGRLLGRPGSFLPEEIQVMDQFRGGGYAVVGDLERQAIRLFARLEGILLDPVYTGRAAGAMLDLIQSGQIGRQERVLFWHTGGTPALFAYSEGLTGRLEPAS